MRKSVKLCIMLLLLCVSRQVLSGIEHPQESCKLPATLITSIASSNAQQNLINCPAVDGPSDFTV